MICAVMGGIVRILVLKVIVQLRDRGLVIVAHARRDSAKARIASHNGAIIATVIVCPMRTTEVSIASTNPHIRPSIQSFSVVSSTVGFSQISIVRLGRTAELVS
jgi:hypothetical protein